MSVPEAPLRTRIIVAGVGLLGTLTLAAPTAATTASTTLAVSATVAATCSVSAVPVALGPYSDVVATNPKVVIACTNNTPYTVGLSTSHPIGGTASTRPLTGGGILPKYRLTSDAVHAIHWVDNGTDTVTATGNGAIQPMTVYSPLSAGRRIASNASFDTVTATVIW